MRVQVRVKLVAGDVILIQEYTTVTELISRLRGLSNVEAFSLDLVDLRTQADMADIVAMLVLAATTLSAKKGDAGDAGVFGKMLATALVEQQIPDEIPMATAVDEPRSTVGGP